MAKKRRKKAHRSRRSNPKKKAHRRKKHRRAVSNPKRRRRHTRRARAANPRRHARARARRSNPGRRRRHRRNPGAEGKKKLSVNSLGFGAIAALVGFAGTFAVGYVFTKPEDMATKGMRNRAIAAVGLSALALFLFRKKPFVAVGAVIGSALQAFGSWLTVQTYNLLPQKQAAATPAKTTNAVYAPTLSGYQAIGGYQPIGELAAVYANDMRGMGEIAGYERIGDLGAVYMNNMAGMGDLRPSAPWMMATPFDGRGQ